MKVQYKYLLIGGGMTADAAVKGIREVDATGRIGIISAEPQPPYARPPLSKGLWTGAKSMDDIWCGTERKGAELLQSRRAVSLDADAREVGDDQGDVFGYERLLIATGGAPRRLPFEDEAVIYYRTHEDYGHLRRLVEARARFAVLGGGFIGAEMAAALTLNEKQVTMVFPETAVHARLLPAGLAKQLNAYYEKRGITLVMGRKPSAIATAQGVSHIHLENGHKFSADGIVAGLGIIPQTQLAEAAGLAVNDGIQVDPHLRTTNPHIFAAGDVANFYSPVLDQRMRVEHEDNALTMGAQAGRNMAGAEEPYNHLPYFYSDLFDLGYEAVGQTDPALTVLTDLKELEDAGCLFYLKADRVRGVVFWNIFGKVAAGRELIAAPGPHTPDGLRAWQKERLAE